MDGIKPVVGQGGASGSGKAATGGTAVSTPAGSRAQTDARAAGILCHRVRSADGLSVEGAAQRVWQRQRGAQAFSGVAESGVLPPVVASRAGRIRRDAGHCLGVAKHRRGYGKSTSGERVRGAEPHGPGKKMAANEVYWWTAVASRCRSSPAGPTWGTGICCRRLWIEWWARGPNRAGISRKTYAGTPDIEANQPGTRRGLATIGRISNSARRKRRQSANNQAGEPVAG